MVIFHFTHERQMWTGAYTYLLMFTHLLQYVLLRHRLGHSKCSVCGDVIKKLYMPMKEWSVSGAMCGLCYSSKLHDHYPGKHVRMGSS